LPSCLQFTSMWNITGTRIHMNTRGSEPWASGSLIPGSNYSAQVSLVSERMQCAPRTCDVVPASGVPTAASMDQPCALRAEPAATVERASASRLNSCGVRDRTTTLASRFPACKLLAGDETMQKARAEASRGPHSFLLLVNQLPCNSARDVLHYPCLL